MFLRFLLSLLLAAWLLSACGGCSADIPPQGSGTPQGITASTSGLPELHEPTAQEYAAHDIPLTATEFAPFDGRVFLTAGKPDFENLHTATVMVSTLGPLAAAECSGILLAPRLVLTAASCVCLPRQESAPKGRPSTMFDSATCSPSAYVTTIVYGDVVNEYMAATGTSAFTGLVRPHPDFKLILDEHQAVVTNQADLAVIVLETPVTRRIRFASLSSQEVHAQETLVMTGYGYGKELGQIFGLRFIRRDKVLGEAVSDRGRFFYEQQGTFLYHGFKGGPCFHEDGGRYALAGIASLGTAQELSLTSTYAHRAWLDAEIRRASRNPPAPTQRPE